MAEDELARRLAEIERQGKARYGEFWDQTGVCLEKAMTGSDPEHQSGPDGLLTAEDLRRMAFQPNAADRIFACAMEHAPQKVWDEWRNEQPRRRARIERTRG